MFHSQLTLLGEIFLKNGYLENLIDRWFKLSLNRIRSLKEKVCTVEKYPLRIISPSLFWNYVTAN